MNKVELRLLAVWGLFLGFAAIGRLASFSSLSPPDLAFFHQSTWSAAQGLGFVQTALEFDDGAIFDSVHLSLVRGLWLPFYWIFPRIETLVLLQALSIGMAGWAALRLLRTESSRSRLVAPCIVLSSPLMPMLATVDVRPLVFLVPSVLWLIVGLRERRNGWAILACLAALCSREEAPYVVLALLPWAYRDRPNERRIIGLVGILALSAWAFVEFGWSGAGGLRTHTDPNGVWASIVSGERPLLRWQQEWQFMGLVMLGALPAFRIPVLLAPGVLAWFYLAIFSGFEPMAPNHGGLHYLAVVAPFVIGALALGLGRLLEENRLRDGRMRMAWAMAVLVSAPSWFDCIDWIRADWRTDTPGLERVVSDLRQESGGALVDPRVAPLLSGRSMLKIQGHFEVSPESSARVVSAVDWALLPQSAPPGEAGAVEWDLWMDSFAEGGLRPLRTTDGWVLWGR